jgi:pilus assembly protein CpaE
VFVKAACSAVSNTSGAATVEFALIASVLVVPAFLCMVDVGLAVNERLSIDSALRAGVQRAYEDPGAADVREIVATVAGKDFTVSPAGTAAVTSSHLKVNVDRICSCPSSIAVAVNCASPGCAAGASPYVYYRLIAEKYANSALLPPISLRTQLLVHIE